MGPTSLQWDCTSPKEKGRHEKCQTVCTASQTHLQGISEEKEKGGRKKTLLLFPYEKQYEDTKLKSNLIMMTNIFTMWDEAFSCAMKHSFLKVSRKRREDVKTTPGILAAY